MYPYLLYGIKQVSVSTLGRMLNDGEEFTVRRVGNKYLIFADGFVHKAHIYKPLCIIDMLCDRWACSLIYHWVYCFVCTIYAVLFVIYLYMLTQGNNRYQYMS